MTKKEFYYILEQIAVKNSQLAKEIEELALMIESSGSDQVDNTLNQDYLAKHSSMTLCMWDQFEFAQQHEGMVFPVHKTYLNEIRQHMKLAEHNEHYRNRATMNISITY